MLNIIDIPPPKVKLVESSLKPAALKLIGTGDQAVTGFAPAYINAVSQAAGCNIKSVPVYPEIIESILSRQKQKEISDEN
jgi:CO/xanthine dehydrogenase Mo-binding subunit